MTSSAGSIRETFSTALIRYRGQPAGFDYLRISLAVAIVFWHGILTTQGTDRLLWASWIRPAPAILLPMFFCLSGFLVAGSLQRNSSIKDFLLLRVIRIVPALVVEVFLCALILGPLLTSKSWSEYFSAPDFYAYFLNIVGFVHYKLPGLFVTNPYPEIVNLNLRTLPPELYCYVMLAVLAVAGVVRRHHLLLAFCVVTALVATLLIWPSGDIKQYHPPTGYNMIIAFLFGVAAYSIRERIPHRSSWFVIALLVSIALLFRAETQYLAIPFIAYVTLYMGLWNPPKKGFLFSGDYSYGLYLYGFPLQQLYAYLFPDYLNWLANVTFALTFGLIYAWLSWTLVEKPLLIRKNRIIASINSALAVFSPNSRQAEK